MVTFFLLALTPWDCYVEVSGSNHRGAGEEYLCKLLELGVGELVEGSGIHCTAVWRDE